LSNDQLVSFGAFPLQLIQQLSPTPDFEEQVTAFCMSLTMGLQVLFDVLNIGRQPDNLIHG
jgi:hypothetical protein